MADSVYLTFRPRRVVASLALGVAVVVTVAFLARALVEGLTSFTYTIHWLETIPLLVVGVAFVVNAWLNERAETPKEQG